MVVAAREGTKQMVDTILFDLDGTLLPLDAEAFLGAYLVAVGKYFAHLVDPRHMISSLLRATEEMIHNQEGDMTNEEVFWKAFIPMIGIDREILFPGFEQFYREEFPKLKSKTRPTPLARKVLEAALARGYTLVLATNPVFPREAILERMRWAGIDGYPWALITSFENFNFCKPYPSYYRQIVTALGRKPERCLVVGNDVQEDLVASSLGMATFLVTDCLIDRGTSPRNPLAEGCLEDFLVFLVEDGPRRLRGAS